MLASLKRAYLRYNLATELYIVEPWERAVIHVVYGIFFIMFLGFNYLALSFLAGLRSSKPMVDEAISS